MAALMWRFLLAGLKSVQEYLHKFIVELENIVESLSTKLWTEHMFGTNNVHQNMPNNAVHGKKKKESNLYRWRAVTDNFRFQTIVLLIEESTLWFGLFTLMQSIAIN